MNHIVDTCPLTQFEGGLNQLHEADDDAVVWLESFALHKQLFQSNTQLLFTHLLLISDAIFSTYFTCRCGSVTVSLH